MPLTRLGRCDEHHIRSLCRTIWLGTGPERPVPERCHPCLRYDLLPMCPGWTPCCLVAAERSFGDVAHGLIERRAKMRPAGGVGGLFLVL